MPRMGSNRLFIAGLVMLIAISGFPWKQSMAAESSNGFTLPKDVHMGFKVEKYATFPEYVAALKALGEMAPDMVSLHSDRTTYAGNYPLYWVTLGDTTKRPDTDNRLFVRLGHIHLKLREIVVIHVLGSQNDNSLTFFDLGN